MSPVSRGRKNKGKAKAASSGPPPAARTNDALNEVLHGFGSLAKEQDPLDAEVFVSSVFGGWWAPEDGEFGERAGLALIDGARRKANPPALALLRTMHVVGLTSEQRATAGRAAEELATQGVAEARWADALDDPTAGTCWRMGDVYGEGCSLLCWFERGGLEHALVVLLDFTNGSTSALDAYVVTNPGEILAEMRAKQHEHSSIIRVEEVSQGRARWLIESAIQDTDLYPHPELEEDFVDFRALALARCRVLPEPEPEEETDEDQSALVSEFIRAAVGIEDNAENRRCAEVLLEFGNEYDARWPLRVGPHKLTTFVEEWLPGEVLSPEEAEAMPDVLVAWTDWAAARAGIPGDAMDELRELAEELAAGLGAEEEFDQEPSLIDLYLDGSEEVPDIASLGDLLSRRGFAVPSTETTVGEDYFELLDPRDPDERRLLIVGEHPEFHAALDDPDFDGEIDGVNPRLHITMKELVINQLWDGDPPEAWEAVKRMLAADMDREDILRVLGELVVQNVSTALTEGASVDEWEYRAALNALGR